MRPLTLTLLGMATLGLLACQRQSAPQTSAAAPTPSPIAASAPPLSAAPGDTLPPSGPEATPGPSDIGGAPNQPESGRIDPATGVRIETAPTPRPRRQAPTPRPRTENRPPSDTRGSSEPVPAPERPRT